MLNVVAVGCWWMERVEKKNYVEKTILKRKENFS